MPGPFVQLLSLSKSLQQKSVLKGPIIKFSNYLMIFNNDNLIIYCIKKKHNTDF